MVIQKVINNNVISAYDENQQEVVIMGKGIGFKAHMVMRLMRAGSRRFSGLRTRSFPGSFRRF